MNKIFCSDISLDRAEPLCLAQHFDFFVFHELPITEWPRSCKSADLPDNAINFVRYHTKGKVFRLLNFCDDSSRKTVDKPKTFLITKNQVLLYSEETKEIEYTDNPLVFICTHGKRDACCAKKGNAAYKELSKRNDLTAFMCSHTGGDRYAANALMFPEGQSFGRLTGNNLEEFPFTGNKNKLEQHLKGNVWQDATEQLINRYLAKNDIELITKHLPINMLIDVYQRIFLI